MLIAIKISSKYFFFWKMEFQTSKKLCQICGWPYTRTLGSRLHLSITSVNGIQTRWGVSVYRQNSRFAIWTKRQKGPIPRHYSVSQYTDSSPLSGSLSVQNQLQNCSSKLRSWEKSHFTIFSNIFDRIMWFSIYRLVSYTETPGIKLSV